MVKIFGLIGYPLTHSFSERYFSEKFNKEGIIGIRYLNFPINSISDLPDLINKDSSLRGLNVTIPYKEAVIPFLDELSESASEIGAVNTVKIFRKGTYIITKGYNTDTNGFEKSLEVNKVEMPLNTLILGTGGASKAVEWVLKKHHCKVIFATRNPVANNHVSYEELTPEQINEFQLIVNSTPLGMYPKTEQYPDLPYHAINSNTTFFDLIYNPAETIFLRKARERNCKTINGLYMLEQQAEKAWEIWNNK